MNQQLSMSLERGPQLGEPLAIGRHACVLPGAALAEIEDIMAELRLIAAAAPFRHMITPGGFTMSMASTNCGHLGWTADRRGYRYTEYDPGTGAAWPPMSPGFSRLARDAAAIAGFDNFDADACLINRYTPNARLSLHQDKDERDFGAPIVTVSLGMTATFLFGGLERGLKAARIPLTHGDVVVWGGEDRLRYHGILPLKDAPHALLGSTRISLTFRKAG